MVKQQRGTTDLKKGKKKITRNIQHLVLRVLRKIMKKGQDEGIRWRKDGEGITIYDKNKVINQTLPKYFDQWDWQKFTANLHECYFKWMNDEKPYVSYYHRDFCEMGMPKFIYSRTQQQRRRQKEKEKEKKNKPISRQNSQRQSTSSKRQDQKIKIIQSNTKITKPIKNDKQKLQIQFLHKKVLSSYKILLQESKTIKGNYFEYSTQIDDSLEDIKSMRDLKDIQNKAHQAKIKNRSFRQTFKKFYQSLQDFQIELKKFFQNNSNRNLVNQRANQFTPSKIKETSLDTEHNNTQKKEKIENAKTQATVSRQEIRVPPKPTAQQSPSKKSDKLFNSPIPAKQPTLSSTWLNTNSSANKQSNGTTTPYLRPVTFLKKYFNQNQILIRYVKVQNIQNGTVYFKLNLENTHFDMKDFLRHDWRNVHKLNLSDCKLSTQDWQQFCKNYQLFKNLRLLSIASNNIEQISQNQVQKFPDLEDLNLGQVAMTINPLNDWSKKQMKELQKQKKNKLRILMYNPDN